MIELKASRHHFNPAHFGTVDHFLSTADRNERDTLMIACSDHGTAPDSVSFAGSGRFLILQHLAACVPPPEDHAIENPIAAIQMGFENYNLRQVIICGHLGCGVIPNWLQDSASRDTGGLRYRFRAAVVQAVQAAYPELTGRAYVERLICEHALCQLENLQAHPFIREKLDTNALKLHLWIVNDKTARVLSFDPRRKAFVAIEEMK